MSPEREGHGAIQQFGSPAHVRVGRSMVRISGLHASPSFATAHSLLLQIMDVSVDFRPDCH